MLGKLAHSMLWTLRERGYRRTNLPTERDRKVRELTRREKSIGAVIGRLSTQITDFESDASRLRTCFARFHW